MRDSSLNHELAPQPSQDAMCQMAYKTLNRSLLDMVLISTEEMSFTHAHLLKSLKPTKS